VAGNIGPEETQQIKFTEKCMIVIGENEATNTRADQSNSNFLARTLDSQSISKQITNSRRLQVLQILAKTLGKTP